MSSLNIVFDNYIYGYWRKVYKWAYQELLAYITFFEDFHISVISFYMWLIPILIEKIFLTIKLMFENVAGWKSSCTIIIWFCQKIWNIKYWWLFDSYSKINALPLASHDLHMLFHQNNSVHISTIYVPTVLYVISGKTEGARGCHGFDNMSSGWWWLHCHYQPHQNPTNHES